VADLLGGVVPVQWDADAFPYLASVRWDERGLTLEVQSRDQRRTQVLVVNHVTGATTVRVERHDPVWVDLVAGTPAWLGTRVVTTVDDPATDTRRLALDGEAVSPPGLQVRRVVGVHAEADEVLVAASGSDPTEVHVSTVRPDGTVRTLTAGAGVHDAVAGGGVVVTTSSGMDHDGAVVRVLRGGTEVAAVASHAEVSVVVPSVAFSVVGTRELRTAVLLPGGADPDVPLPVLLDPYGGPHAQRVLRARSAFHTSQWLADQGFAVVVADGRGTPGRGPAFEKAVHLDLAGPVLDDQIDALHAVAAADARLDLARVAIRGWSFGGYLAALAVLRRPDVFSAAVAGAPVTDWRLYDTHYTERYLGHPDEQPDAYARTTLLTEAARLERPLLLVHGLADDNVVVAHTLQLSRALLEAGRPHQVLPLSGVTHMTPQEVVAENLLLLQVAFLREALGLEAAPGGG
jgi:dipeptidyl-peptidase-4